MAPLAEPVPPKFYGVTERVIFWLTDEYRSVINSSLRRAAAFPRSFGSYLSTSGIKPITAETHNHSSIAAPD
jgi:hypothetical protein